MKFQPDKFDKIIFDMDGVITSEYIYWDTAAMTVYELLLDYRYYGKREIDREWCAKSCAEIRRTVFCGDKTIRAVKNLGVNTNWDLAYLVFCISAYINPSLDTLDEWHFESVRMFIENIAAEAPEVYDLAAKLAAGAMGVEFQELRRGTGALWHNLVESFQRWFLGYDEIDGLCKNEAPLLPLADIKSTLGSLKGSGIKLGIGTGRPRGEIMYPLNMWGLMPFFDENMIVTYDEVKKAEESLNLENKLAKPHPFVFLKAAFGDKLSDKELLRQRPNTSRVCVVGDAPSDLLSAKSSGMRFVGVLTGVDAESAKEYFTSRKADYIFDDITDMVK